MSVIINILFAISHLNGGGAQRTLVNILRHLNRNTFKSGLMLFDYHPEQAFAKEIPADVEIFNLNTRGRYAVGKIGRILKSEKPDCVFSTLPQVNTAVSLAHFFTSAGCKQVLRETNYRGSNYRLSPINHYLNKFSFRRCDKAVALSRGVAEELKRHYDLKDDKIQVIYNPIDLEDIQKKALVSARQCWSGVRSFKLVSCGRLVEQKNYGLLLKALALIGSKFQWELMIIGAGPKEKELKQLARDLKLHDRVHFTGFQANPYPYIKQADLFVLPSRWEGFGHVIVEAMACGVPVVAADCPYGPGEILGDNAYGWLVPNNDHLAMSVQIEAVAANYQEAVKKRDLAFDRARDFDVKTIINKYENLFVDVLEKEK